MDKPVIDLSKTVYELCRDNKDIPGILASVGFRDIVKPGMIETAGRFMTVPKGCQLRKISLDTVRDAFAKNGYVIKEELV